MPKTIRQVVTKESETTLSDTYNIGVLARNVIDLRPAQGTEYAHDENETGYTLAQLIDSYMTFLNEVPFMYVGPSDDRNSNSLVNSHTGLWIDTSDVSSNYWVTRE
jgi:hypothetical protein